MKKQVLAILMFCSACVGAERMRIESWDVESGQIVFNTLSNSVNHHYWVEQGNSPSGPWTNAAECTPAEFALSVTCSVAVAGQMGYFRACTATSAVPEGMVWVVQGSFQMGDACNDGYDGEDLHTVELDAFLMDECEVSGALWGEVRGWAVTNGYAFVNPGSAKGTNHPVHTVNWHDCVKWCNARTAWFNNQVGTNALTPAYHTSSNLLSEYRTGQVDLVYVDPDSTGYRLPTEAQWEKAARGGVAGNRFPCGMDIDHDCANYWANGNAYPYDASGTTTYTYHPDYETNSIPYTCPVGDLPANGYGLHNMVGNVWEWCWDWYKGGYYTNSPTVDPMGPDTGTERVIRGGCWTDLANQCRVAYRAGKEPHSDYYVGFRTVLPFPSPVSEF